MEEVAKLIERSCMIRLKLDHLIQVLFGILVITLLDQKKGQLEVSLRVIGIDLQRLLKMRLCFFALLSDDRLQFYFESNTQTPSHCPCGG